MDARQRADLDRHITGDYGEAQFKDYEGSYLESLFKPGASIPLDLDTLMALWHECKRLRGMLEVIRTTLEEQA